MQRIHYAGGEVVTGTAIAKELMHLAEALAKHRTAESVEIPVRTASGALSRATLLVGPASQLVSEPLEADDGDELVDEHAVDELRRRVAAITSRPVVGPPGLADPAGVEGEFDWPEA